MSPRLDPFAAARRRFPFLGHGEERAKAACVAAALAASIAAFIGFGAVSGSAGMGGFEAGKVADHDVAADRDVIYVDVRATAIRAEAERRLVPAVFSIDETVSRGAVEALASLRKSLADLAPVAAGDEFALRLRSRFPDLDPGLLDRLIAYPAPAGAIDMAKRTLERLFSAGVFAVPETGLEPYNPGTVELRRFAEGPVVYEQVPIDRLTTLRRFRAVASEAVARLKLPAATAGLVIDLASAFAKENAFFDAAQSERRLEQAASRVEPVMRRIAKGEKVIRQGFIVTAEDIERLAALRGPSSRLDVRRVLGGVVALVLLTIGAAAALSSANTGRRLDLKSLAFVASMSAVYFAAAAAFDALLPARYDGQLEAFLPTALVAMLAAITLGERFALILTSALSLSLSIAVGFDAFVPVQALFAGAAGIMLVRRAERRIDLVRAGAQLAAWRFIAGTALSALAGRGFLDSLGTGFWSSMNGFLCGVLALALLPVLEQALNAMTVFRLQELSDLNAPTLKRLLAVAPGTYSHSVTVAHLAESACREIGADALLARVGAYYHDIGKIERPEYFIENQAGGYNKHDDINPRLSATVIRGHVTFGLERADALRLPEQVKAIIAEHHGTSLIGYFYERARRESGDGASSEDYRYPGPLPASRESAVVMLADCVEAASRTMKRPTIGKLEQYVKELVMDRHENGQLSMSSLTFRDLELIKNSFVRVLSGHFHSRIEYPRTREPA